MGKLDGKKIAFLQTDGVEQVELEKPLEAIRGEGAEVTLVSLQEASSRRSTTSTRATGSRPTRRPPTPTRASSTAWCCPAGSRTRTSCAPTRAPSASCASFFEQSKPVAAICHGPWTLVEAGVVKGRTVTSWPSLKTDCATRAPSGSTRRCTSTRAW